MGVSETESPEDVAARQRLKKISLSRLSDSYIAALEIADVYSLLTKHSQGEWPPARPELKL